VAHANHAAKVKRQAIRSASRRDGEALQAENPFPANFEDWLRRQDRPDAQEVLRQIIDRRDRAKAVKRDHLIDPRQVMETLGAKFGWDLRATAGAARIYGDGAKLKMQKQIAVITDAAGQGLRWLDMVGQKTGSIRRLVSTIMGKEKPTGSIPKPPPKTSGPAPPSMLPTAAAWTPPTYAEAGSKAFPSLPSPRKKTPSALARSLLESCAPCQARRSSGWRISRPQGTPQQP
jgi:hypothetical protein